MTREAAITRDLIVERLGSVRYPRFLLYVMGPYKSFNLNHVLSEEERDDIEVSELPGPLRKLFQNRSNIDEAQALLRRVQGSLRVDPGVNAFLAVDIDVDIDTVNAVTQSIEYARCSNLSIFVLPYLGHNFGVGEEAGSVLANLSETHGERMVFLHEDDVTSAMISSARDRWEVTVEPYASEAELLKKVRLYAGEIMEMERQGELPQLQ